MIDIKKIAKAYNPSDFMIVNEVNSTRGKEDVRYSYIIKFADGQEIVIKACKNSFTNSERIAGWQSLCVEYLRLGIYCPQIINTEDGESSQTVNICGQEFYVFAEEIKKYKTYTELSTPPCFEVFKTDIVESTAKIAANCKVKLPWQSAFCLYDTFCEDDKADENYQNAESFYNTIKTHFPQHSAYADEIWKVFLHKRKLFEPIYRALPKAAFQGDLNQSNILVTTNKFKGLIDFNLCGAESILAYAVLPEVCLYEIEPKDLEQLNDKKFLQKCDDYFYKNLSIFTKDYRFTDFEEQSLNLCYNTVVPFCFWMTERLINFAIKENKTEYIKNVMDWVFYQLDRDDIKLKG